MIYYDFDAFHEILIKDGYLDSGKHSTMNYEIIFTCVDVIEIVNHSGKRNTILTSEAQSDQHIRRFILKQEGGHLGFWNTYFL